MSTLSIFIVIWLAIVVVLTLSWMVLVTIRNRWGSLTHYVEIQLRKFFKP